MKSNDQVYDLYFGLPYEKNDQVGPHCRDRRGIDRHHAR
jgi:hypothetical protein